MKGPAIVIANHNSHLDTLVIITRFPLSVLPRVRIAAASDYFFTNPITKFIAKWFLGLVPISRSGGRSAGDSLQAMVDCLSDDCILVLFPEGSRGKAEALGEFKSGLWHLLKRCPKVSLHPLYLYGLGRSLPKGEWIPVPFFIDVCIGETILFDSDKMRFLQTVRQYFYVLRDQTLAKIAIEKTLNESLLDEEGVDNE